MALTSEAKRLLAETIRGTTQDPTKGLRHRLLDAIRNEAAGRYRLAVPLKDADLDEAHRRRRERLEAYLDEKTRATKPKSAAERGNTRERLLREAEKEAAATLLNRLITLRLLEAQGLSRSPVVTGGWNSRGYREFREFGPALLDDETDGYAFLLQLVFDELATELPGLFGDIGVTKLFPIPPKALRDVVESLDNVELASAWTDDVTLGWVYQYWNDPDREVLDTKINGGGKVESHEIASKTQMFTERYMVEWLLQNSLGLTWLSVCKKHGWVADAERVLPALDARRSDWCKKRDIGEVALDALMPIEGLLEERWKYYVSQPIPDDAVENAPESVRAIKLLDPACGSGHFLVIAFGLLVALYREEARHLGTTLTDREIAESILENNLHGIDIDPRAIQIAAAGLYIKAKVLAKSARPKRLNLVAPVLQLGNLPTDDPAVAVLRNDLKQEAGIPEELTTKLLSALAGVDYLGSLLKVDAAIEDAIKNVELEFERTQGQGNLFGGFPARQVKLTVGEAKATILDKLERFLAKHSKSEDLGLRLDGEQLAAGVRFVRMAKEGSYDLVVGNPPYQGTPKLRDVTYLAATYREARPDLFAMFIKRALELTRAGGSAALVTMRSWLFLGQFGELREWLRREATIGIIADLHFGAFSTMKDVSVAMTTWGRGSRSHACMAVRPVHHSKVVRDLTQVARNEAGLVAPAQTYSFHPNRFASIGGAPYVYWWTDELIASYARAQKLGDIARVRQGMATSNNARFLRRVWEQSKSSIWIAPPSELGIRNGRSRWVPYVKGAQGRSWFEPLGDVIEWAERGLQVKVLSEATYGSHTKRIPSERWYGTPGVSFNTVGSSFFARVLRYASILDVRGSCVFHERPELLAVIMNARRVAAVLESLNPGVNFQVGDVVRLPIWEVQGGDAIYRELERAFVQHEESRETSVHFRAPGASCWTSAQRWAQDAVDRAAGADIVAHVPQYEEPEPQGIVSFAFGVAIGRFATQGVGIDRVKPSGLPSGNLFVSSEGTDSLDHPACAPLHEAWKKHGAAIGGDEDLRTYLRRSFFAFHKKFYEKRPIYFPLSSARKNFVAFASIHRWGDDTLNALLADHLVPAKRRLEGELEDLRIARASANNAGKTEKRFSDVQKLLEELNDFIGAVTEVAEKGPRPPDDKTTKREVDSRYVMDLDDGVMVNSAALWPLLEPQWKDPRKWWKELTSAQGKKDYDWSHLAARYFPTRVYKKCEEDPSLAVAHGRFWELHPAKAYAWELRLQDEIGPDFTIDEQGVDAARKKFLAEHSGQAKEVLAAEIKRRERKVTKEEDQLGLLDEAADDEIESDSDE